MKGCCLCSGLYCLLLFQGLQTSGQEVVKVTDCNLHGWVKQTQPGTRLSLTNDAAVSVLSKGSAEFSTPNKNYVRFRSTSYHNTLLSSLTSLSYSTFVVSRGSSIDNIYIVLLIDKNDDGLTDDNLVFNPHYQTGNYVEGKLPDQGPTVENEWQAWDMLHGGWWVGPPPKPDPDADPDALISLAAYISQNPGARIVNDPSLGGGGIRVTAGSPVFAPGFLARFDAFAIGINAATTVYDFEYTTADAGVDKVVVYGYGSGCTLLNGSASGGVAPYTYSWAPGGVEPGVPDPDVCPTTTTHYVLTVTDANGCARTDETVVFVNDVRCGNLKDKVTICHNGSDICVSSNAVEDHLNHGDFPGACNYSPTSTMPEQSNAGIMSSITPGGDRASTEASSRRSGTSAGNARLSSYPNPFTRFARIQYDVPFNSKVTIKVYDAMGREMATLVNEFKSAGRYSVDFDAGRLAKGVYFSRLSALDGDRSVVQTHRLVLEK